MWKRGFDASLAKELVQTTSLGTRVRTRMGDGMALLARSPARPPWLEARSAGSQFKSANARRGLKARMRDAVQKNERVTQRD